MQRVPSELDIDGHMVHIGCTVEVRWLGVWYQGTVTKIGPKRNLCKVRDVETGKTLLVESWGLKFMETHVLDKQMSAGTHVAYNNGERWQEAVVESNNAVGAAQVSWRRSALSDENLTWFELPNIAPVIQNEAYEEHNKDMLAASKSGLLHNDPIEPHPRTIENMLYESESDHEQEKPRAKPTHKSSPARSKQTNRRTDSEKQTGRSRTDPEEVSPIYEAVPENIEKDAVSSLPSPPPPPPFPFPPFPPYMPLPPMSQPVTHPYQHMYLPYGDGQFMKVSPSFMSARSSRAPLPHPRQLKKPGLANASVPCIMSYTRQTNGIPPHPSSRFFQKLRGHLNNHKLLHFSPAHMKKSPTIESRAHSEPTHNTEHFFIPPNLMEPSPSHQLQPQSDKSDKSRHPKISTKPHPSKTTSHAEERSSPHHLHSHPSPSHNFPVTSPSHKHSHPKSPTSTSAKPSQQQKDSPPPALPPRPHQLPGSSTSGQALPGNRPANRRGISSGKAQSRVGEDRTKVELYPPQRSVQVTAPEVASTSPTHVKVPQGGSTLMTCVAKSSEPVQYEWWKDDKMLPEESPFYTHPAPGMLQIQKATLNHTGEYCCVATNKHGTVQRVFQLEVTADVVSGSAGGSTNAAPQPQFTSKVIHEELNMDVAHNDQDSDNEGEGLGHPAASQPPVIVVQEPESDVGTPAVAQRGRDHGPQPRNTDLEKDEGMEEGEQGNTATKKIKATKRNRRRVSAVLKNDMELYLEGYGEDYGALSSKTNLQLEPWLEDVEDMGEERVHVRKGGKAKKKRKKAKKGGSQGSASPTKSNESPQRLESPKKGRKAVSFSKLPKNAPALLRRKKKNMGTVGPEEKEPDEDRLQAWQDSQERDNAEEELNSVEVHTSLGASSASEISLGGQAKGDRLQLPQEEETLNESVRRLQISVQEYGPEQIVVQKGKKKGFLSSIFSSKNK